MSTGTGSVWHNPGGILTFYDRGTSEQILPLAPVLFCDDFLGAYLQKYISAENTTAQWKTVETALNTAIGLSADAVNGVAALILDSDDNAEVACLYFGDNECLSLKQGLIFEARVTFSTLPTTGTETVQAVLGLAGDHNTDLDTIDVGAWFRVESAANTALLWETDDDSVGDDDNATGITLVAGTYNIFRIDATDIAAVKFYVDGNKVGTGDMSGLTTTTCKVQPYFNISKAKTTANTGTGTMLVDYIRAWQKRS